MSVSGRHIRKSLSIIAGVVVVCAISTVAALRLSESDSSAQPAPVGSAADMPLRATSYPVPDGAIFVAPDGRDSGAGTKDSPLRSLSAAIDRAPAGATVVLRGGTYRESAGTVRKRVTIQSYPSEAVWLKGSIVVSGWQRDGDVWRHDGWTAELCHDCYTPGIIDDRYPHAGRPDMVFVDGTPLRQVGSPGEVGPGTFYVDKAGDALLIGDDPGGRTVESTAFDKLLQFDGAAAAGSVIRGIGIAQYGSNQDYGNDGAMVMVNSPDVRLENSTFGWSASSGAAIFQPGGTVSGSSFVDNGLVGLVANRADDLRMTGNVFARNNQERFALGGNAIGAAGAKITRTKRPYVADNQFRDNLATGWWCDLGCSDATVIRNVSTGNAVNGLYYEVSARAVIASNLVAGNGARGLKVSSSDRVRVYHNTFADNPVNIGLYNDERDPSFDPYSEQLGMTWATTDTVLVNNLHALGAGDQLAMDSGDGKDSPPRSPFVSRSDGNAYLRTGDRPGVLLSWSRGSGEIVEYRSLAELRKATGHEAHGLAGSSRPSPFADAARGNYTLRAGALGSRAGVPIPGEAAAALDVPPDPHPDIGILATS